jgi:multidrug efflux system membrane fusion protein
MKLKTILPLVVAGLVGAAAWGWWANAPADGSPPPSRPTPVPVQAVQANRQDIPIYVTGLGTVQALNTVTVTPRVDGQLVKVAFHEGQDVKAGDLLAQIDPRPFQAALDQAMAKKAQDVASLQNAELDLKRFLDLSRKDFATQQQLDTQRTLVAQTQAMIQGDQAAIDNARTQLDYTTIRSPIDGRTGFRLVDQGNNVHATDTAGIVVITQIHPISVVFTLPEENLQAVAKAMAQGTVQATALASDNTTVLDLGKVALIDNVIDQATGTARFKAEFPNTNDTLWPGEFVNVRILLQTRHNALTIPLAAVERGPDGLFAYVVTPNNVVEARPITVGVNSRGIAVVDHGLVTGERVVTAGQYRLQPGASVQPAPVRTSAATPTTGKS